MPPAYARLIIYNGVGMKDLIKPLLSVVIPMRNASQYIENTLSSFLVLRSSSSVQVVIVDDASTDNSKNIAYQFIKENGLDAIILEGFGQGPGIARNLGINHACGKYLAFLDADDYINIKEMIDLCELMKKNSCELGVYNHCRLYGDGKIKKNKRSDILTSFHHKVLEGDKKIPLLYNFNVAWNKIYSTNFIKKNKLNFPPGIYEDIPWSIMCLVAANIVIADCRVMYTYRQHEGSVLKVKGEQHLVLLDQYQLAVDFLNKYPKNSCFEGPVKQRAVEHAFLIAYQRSRMCRSLRKQHFNKILSFISNNSCKLNTFSNKKLSLKIKASLLMGTSIFLEVGKIRSRLKKTSQM